MYNICLLKMRWKRRRSRLCSPHIPQTVVGEEEEEELKADWSYSAPECPLNATGIPAAQDGKAFNGFHVNHQWSTPHRAPPIKGSNRARSSRWRSVRPGGRKLSLNPHKPTYRGPTAWEQYYASHAVHNFGLLLKQHTRRSTLIPVPTLLPKNNNVLSSCQNIEATSLMLKGGWCTTG